jgi:hypothetical protein
MSISSVPAIYKYLNSKYKAIVSGGMGEGISFKGTVA